MKRDRLLTILEEVNKNYIIKTSDLIKKLRLSDMTFHRDLDELARSRKLFYYMKGHKV